MEEIKRDTLSSLDTFISALTEKKVDYEEEMTDLESQVSHGQYESAIRTADEIADFKTKTAMEYEMAQEDLKKTISELYPQIGREAGEALEYLEDGVFVLAMNLHIVSSSILRQSDTVALEYVKQVQQATEWSNDINPDDIIKPEVADNSVGSPYVELATRILEYYKKEQEYKKSQKQTSELAQIQINRYQENQEKISELNAKISQIETHLSAKGEQQKIIETHFGEYWMECVQAEQNLSGMLSEVCEANDYTHDNGLKPEFLSSYNPGEAEYRFTVATDAGFKSHSSIDFFFDFGSDVSPLQTPEYQEAMANLEAWPAERGERLVSTMQKLMQEGISFSQAVTSNTTYNRTAAECYSPKEIAQARTILAPE